MLRASEFSSALYQKMGGKVFKVNLKTNSDQVSSSLDESKSVTDELRTIYSELSKISSSFEEVNGRIDGVQSSIDKTNADLDSVKSELETSKKDISSLQASVKNTNKKIDSIKEELDLVKKDAGETKQFINELGEKLNSLSSQLEEFRNKLDVISSSLVTCYHFNQVAKSKRWNIKHCLGSKDVIVHLFDTKGNEIRGEVDYTEATEKDITVKFGVAIAGSAKVYFQPLHPIDLIKLASCKNK